MDVLLAQDAWLPMSDHGQCCECVRVLQNWKGEPAGTWCSMDDSCMNLSLRSSGSDHELILI